MSEYHVDDSMQTNELPGQQNSLFDRCQWLYAFCREHLFRNHTNEIVRHMFPSGGPLQDTFVLELGCGPGFYARRLAKMYGQIRTIGIDSSARLIARARMLASSENLQNCSFDKGDAQGLSMSCDQVDVVIVSRLFLIVPDREAVLAEVFRILKPGGSCFLAEPTTRLKSRMPLAVMHAVLWMMDRHEQHRRYPVQLTILSGPAFRELVHSQPWAAVQIRSASGYQYAVCEKINPVIEPDCRFSNDKSASRKGWRPGVLN